ncbi:MAG: carbohydrate kinase family protein [Pirellulales bacterium]
MPQHIASQRRSKIAVAGHICLDIIPTFPRQEQATVSQEQATGQIEPGKLYKMGPAVCATGGAVSNTGLALHQLGMPVTLMGKIADDLFGGEVLNVLKRYHPDLAGGMIITRGEETSYSIVISPPEVDRSFLHCTGANDTFCAKDVDLTLLDNVNLFHFGYPTLMQRFYQDGGQQMSKLFQQVQAQGVLTSLDMAVPDPNSAAGRVDWLDWLRRVLPNVDLYLPSIEETLFMLNREDEACLVDLPTGATGMQFDPKLLASLADQLLEMGAGVVVLKLGEEGLYLRSANDRILRFEGTKEHSNEAKANGEEGLLAGSSWSNRELIAPCFEVEVVGTTGAGDSTIAGFLAAVCSGESPEKSLVQAVAVGACSVEVADATSGICSLSELGRRVDAGWNRRNSGLKLDGWSWNEDRGVWHGPHE